MGFLVTKMIKVIHLGKFYFPSRGGIEAVTKSIVESNEMTKFSNELVVFSDQTNAQVLANGTLVKSFRPLLTVFSQPISLLYFFYVLRNISRFDIVLFHFPNMLPLPLLILVPKRIKIVLFWHSDIVGRSFLMRILSPVIRLVVARANKVIVTSKNYYASSPFLKNLDENKANVVPLGIDFPLSRMETALSSCDDLSTSESLPTGFKIAFSLGRLVSYKGYIEFLQKTEFDKMPDDLIFVIAGVGPLYDSIKNEISRLNLCRKVFLIGAISDSTKKQLFERSSLFFLPSLTNAEAFGVVLIEAFSFGKPIVTFDIPGSGVVEVNADPICGTIAPLANYDAFMDAICFYSSYPGSLVNLQERCRNRYFSLFSEDRMVEDVIEVLQT